MSVRAETESFGQRCSYLWIVFIQRAAWALPTRTGGMLFDGLRRRCVHLLPRVRAVVAANQARVLGRDRRLRSFVGARSLRSAATPATGSTRSISSAMARRAVPRRVRAAGVRALRDPVREGRGVIAVLPHLGDWDAAARAMVAHGIPVVAVAEELKPERLFDLFVQARERLGLRVLGHTGGSVGRELATALGAGNVVALVADRDLAGRGVEVEMFGAARRLPAGPAMSRVATGAPIVSADVYQTPTGWSIAFRPVPVGEPTGDVASRREGDHAGDREGVRARDLRRPRGLAPVPARLGGLSARRARLPVRVERRGRCAGAGARARGAPAGARARGRWC